MPDSLRPVVRRLVAEGRRRWPDPGERTPGFLLTGGPSGSRYLDIDGNVWNCSLMAEAIELVPDGPMKVGLVAIAAERVPELADWRPRRPAGAAACSR